jgi:ATP synthase protein I
VLKIALPRPTTDAVSRGARWAAFDDEAQGPVVKPLSREEVAALRQREPAVSPWRVVSAQVLVGAVVGAVAWAASRSAGATASALYGAATVALPGALMARGMTSRLSSVSPLVSAVAVLGWSFAKIALSIAMLAMAPRVVDQLNWPWLLAALVLSMQTYWFALLWRGRPTL